MSLKLKLSALLLSFSIFSFAQTNVSGIISSNTTWALANSPYIVTGNILVNTGVTLTIEAGVSVKVNSGLGIQSKGEVIAIGSSNLRITLTSNTTSPTPGDWSGISILDQSTDPTYDINGNYLSGTIFKNVDILYAGNSTGSGSLSVTDADLYLDNCSILDGDRWGVFAISSNGFINIRECLIKNHTLVGIYASVEPNGFVNISDSRIENNSENGILLVGHYCNIFNNLLKNNGINFGYGMTISPNYGISTSSIIIRKNKFIDNQRGAIYLNKSSFAQISQNLVMNSEVAILSGESDIRLDSNVFTKNSVVIKDDKGKDVSMKYNHILKNNKPTTPIFGRSSDGLIISAYQGFQNIDFGYNMIYNNQLYDSLLIMIKYRNTNTVNFNNNNLLSNNSKYFVYNSLKASQTNIDAKNNFWGTLVSNEIETKIYDWSDNLTKSIVNYTPFLTEPDTLTPISPPHSVTKRSFSGLVTLNWSSNPEADVAGYKIYWGNPTGYSYDTIIDVGNVLSYTLNGITNLSDEYAVVAYDNMADGDDMDVFEGHQSWFAVSEKFSPTINTSNFNGNNISCNGSADGQITLSITDGTAPYTYAWSHDSTLLSNQASNLSAGAYFYTIADTDGLSLTDSILLTEPDSLNFTVSKTDILCAGLNDGMISFSASGGTAPFQYSINGGSNFSSTSSFSALPPAVYPLEVRDANNCSVYDTLTLLQLGFLSLSLDSSSNLSCNGANDGSISVTVASGVLPYSYLWSNGDTIDDISNLAVNTYSLTVTDAAGCFQTLSHTITEPTVLSVSSSVSSFNSFEISCNDASDGSITLNTSGGTFPYSYTWVHDPSLTSNSVSNLDTGTYIYTVTDDHLCSFSDTIVITEPSALSYSVSSTDLLCNGVSTGTIDFTLSGGVSPYQYSINNGGSFFTSPNFSTLSAGIYYTRIKDANNCLTIDTIVLTEPSALFITTDSSANLSCNAANDGFIAVSISGGVSPYTYSWNNGAFISEDVFNLSANSYMLTVTDSNSCSVSMSYTITEPTVLAVSNTVSDFNGYSISCNGAADGSITLNTSGGTSPYSYAWAHDPNLASNNISSLDTGIYIYTVTDDHLCSFSDTIVITQPDSLIIQAVKVYDNNCSNGADGSLAFEVVGGTLPYSFSIFDSIGNVISNVDSIGNLVHSTYSFSVSDANACSASVQNIILAFNHSPIKPIITASDSVICSGTTSLLSLNGGIQSVVWNDGLPGLNRNLPSGSYWVSSMDTNGCLSVSDTIVIEDLIAQDSSAQICLVTYDAVLDKNRIIFNKPDNESGISTYNIYKDVFGVWQIIGTVNNGDSSQFVDNTSQPSSRVARYYIETEDQCGVTYSTINSPIHKTVLLQSSIGSNNEVNLSWNQYEGASIWYYRILRSSTGVGFTAIDSVGSSFNTFIDNNPPTGNTSYFIEAVLTSGCTVKAKNKTYSSLSTNSVTESTIGLTENLSADFNIYPNPTNGVLNIEYLAGKELKNIRLFDSQGKLIQIVRSDNESVQLDLFELPKGIYHLKISMDKGVITKPIIRY